jgi:hypothetical protein
MISILFLTRLLLFFRCVERWNGGAVENRDRTKSTIYLRKLLSGGVLKLATSCCYILFCSFFRIKCLCLNPFVNEGIGPEEVCYICFLAVHRHIFLEDPAVYNFPPVPVNSFTLWDLFEFPRVRAHSFTHTAARNFPAVRGSARARNYMTKFWPASRRD